MAKTNCENLTREKKISRIYGVPKSTIMTAGKFENFYANYLNRKNSLIHAILIEYTFGRYIISMSTPTVYSLDTRRTAFGGRTRGLRDSLHVGETESSYAIQNKCILETK